MSELIENLNSIYATKLQIKEALGTSSDKFEDYPSYIQALTPSGTYNISENGTFNVSSYASAYVDVQGGGGTEYQFVDLSEVSYLTENTSYAFNGQLDATYETITAEFVQEYPDFEPYIGYQLSNVYGIEANEGGTTYYSMYVIKNNMSSYAGEGVYVEGNTVKLHVGEDEGEFCIVDNIYNTKYAGGHGGLTINQNGRYDTIQYAYTYVDVQGGIQPSGTADISENGTFDVSSYEYAYVHTSGAGTPVFYNMADLSNLSDTTYNIIFAGKIHKTYNTIAGTVSAAGSSNPAYISNWDELGMFHNNSYLCFGDYYPNGYMLGEIPEVFVHSCHAI